MSSKRYVSLEPHEEILSLVSVVPKLGYCRPGRRDAHLMVWVLSFASETDDVKQQSGRLAYQLRYPFDDFAFDMARPKHFRDINCKE